VHAPKLYREVMKLRIGVSASLGYGLETNATVPKMLFSVVMLTAENLVWNA
jgi:hypothetical protein